MDNLLITESSADYELLDSGDGQKLERYGKVVLNRPDPQVMWSKSLTPDKWENAHAKYVRTGQSGKWEIKSEFSDDWKINLEGVTFSLKLLPSKHLGVFPEQSAQWKWLTDKISNFQFPISNKNQEIKVLNLFGYTGGASLICAKAGASVCHVDASEFPVNKLKENMELSGLSDKPIRLIVDDARKFVEREIKRGNKYDIIILDPPVYGKGSNDEVWNIEVDLMPLLLRIKGVLSPDPIAVVLSGYASLYSHITYKEMLSEALSSLGGEFSSGELALKQVNGRLLSSGIFVRWSRD